MKLFIFISTDEHDKCHGISVFSANINRAEKIVRKKFVEWGYKGNPQKLAI